MRYEYKIEEIMDGHEKKFIHLYRRRLIENPIGNITFFEKIVLVFRKFWSDFFETDYDRVLSKQEKENKWQPCDVMWIDEIDPRNMRIDWGHWPDNLKTIEKAKSIMEYDRQLEYNKFLKEQKVVTRTEIY